MTNVTLALDDTVVRKVRKLAIDKDTTLTGLVRSYLEDLAVREDRGTDEVINELRACFNRSGLVVGKKTWTREELHDRQGLL